MRGIVVVYTWTIACHARPITKTDSWLAWLTSVVLLLDHAGADIMSLPKGPAVIRSDELGNSGVALPTLALTPAP